MTDHLTWFELRKIWMKKSYLFSALILLSVNLFMNWYLLLPDGAVMSTSQIKEEKEAVKGYAEYLQEIQKEKEQKTGISIFHKQEEETFSSRNLEKSAADYKNMEDVKTWYYPSVGLSSAMENTITDLLVLLLTFLFVGNLICEEKEKGLFRLTRATRYGRMHSIVSKIAALFLHSILAVTCFFGSNLVYFGFTAGIGNLFCSIQSIAPYIESTLHINVLMFIILSLFTKAFVVCMFGLFLMAAAIISRYSFVPYLIGGGLLALSGICYLFVPAYSSLNWVKYLNFIGLMKAENLYGRYLNFNFMGYPVGRLMVSWVTILCLSAIGFGLSAILFVTRGGIESRKVSFRIRRRTLIHSSLIRHEGYKLFVVNKGLMIFVLFVILAGRYHMSLDYSPSMGEAYYQKIMGQLEGKLDSSKEQIIEQEQKRYQKASDKIEEIDRQIADGEIDGLIGEDMKSPYYSEMVFYPWFQKVLAQYENVKKKNAVFVYDTGYLYLFGKKDNRELEDFVFIHLCILLLLGNLFAMEYEKNSWKMISATKTGRRKIVSTKVVIGLITAGVAGVVPWIFKLVQISSVYSMNEIFAAISCIPEYQTVSWNIPIFGWLLFRLFGQVLLAMAAAAFVMVLSDRTKSHVLTLFLSVMGLVVPLVFFLIVL